MGFNSRSLSQKPCSWFLVPSLTVLSQEICSCFFPREKLFAWFTPFADLVSPPHFCLTTRRWKFELEISWALKQTEDRFGLCSYSGLRWPGTITRRRTAYPHLTLSPLLWPSHMLQGLSIFLGAPNHSPKTPTPPLIICYPPNPDFLPFHGLFTT